MQKLPFYQSMSQSFSREKQTNELEVRRKKWCLLQPMMSLYFYGRSAQSYPDLAIYIVHESALGVAEHFYKGEKTLDYSFNPFPNSPGFYLSAVQEF